MDQIRLGDILLDLPDYDGIDPYNKGDSFVNKCNMYFRFTPLEFHGILFDIIKSKFTGHALRRITPYFNQCPDWVSLKSKLKTLGLV